MIKLESRAEKSDGEGGRRKTEEERRKKEKTSKKIAKSGDWRYRSAVRKIGLADRDYESAFMVAIGAPELREETARPPFRSGPRIQPIGGRQGGGGVDEREHESARGEAMEVEG